MLLQLTSLPEDVDASIVNVVSMDAACNALQSIPAWIADMPNLADLRLSKNNLRSLPSLGHACKLIMLDVQSNKLMDLPSRLPYTLQHLNANDNMLHAIASCIGTCTQLITLRASNNKIQTIAEEVGACSLLAELHVAFNAMGHLPQCLGELGMDVHAPTLSLQVSCETNPAVAFVALVVVNGCA